MVTKDFEELFAFHVKPRRTKYIDVFVDPTPENAARLVAALEDFGFVSLGLAAASGRTQDLADLEELG